MSERVGLPLVFVAVGVLFVALGIPLWRGRVRPNFWYGCRTRKTLSDERVWYAVNRVTGRDLIIAGAAITACALCVLLFARDANTTATSVVMLCVTLGGVGAMAFHSLKVSSRM
ncbi:MAG: SdpI/YfhL protein family [Acidobacteriota bacterium]|jgi:uncharacterized membrane protein|nr:SdpI/YfhL protein family [Acidobacteriota bacterium]